MTAIQATDATKICEEILLRDKSYNLEHNILPSENTVIDRLLERRLELIGAYAEIHEKLHTRSHGLETILGVVVNAAAFWNPDRVSESRDARNRLKVVNSEIAAKAAELAELLDERSDLHNHSRFSSNTHYHIAEVIEAASPDNGHFLFYLKDELLALRHRFDFKYWPSLADVSRVVAQDAKDAGTNATDPLTRAATGSRGSRADFFKALFAFIEENSARHYGHLPRGFKLTDSTLASFANCALDLGPDDLIDSAYVKRLRQREREG